MSSVVLCCNTLEDEMNRVLREKLTDPYPVVLVEAGLHNHPKKMRSKLSEELGKLKGHDRVLMAFGHCGGSCVDLESGDFEIILHRADDCLSVLLGSMERRRQISRERSTYFLTAGWMRFEENLLDAFERDCGRFGAQRAERVYKIMLNHYKQFGLIDTGTYDLDEARRKIDPLCRLLDLDSVPLAGDLTWMERLVTGPWDPREFLIVPPRSRLSVESWDWLGQSGGALQP